VYHLAVRIPTSGSRIWVTVYAFGIAAYGLVVFGFASIGVIDAQYVPLLMRWLWSAVFVYLIVDIVTDRRRDGHK